VRRFQGPNPLSQPLQQGEPIRLISKQRLANVQVTVHESRKHGVVGGVEHAKRAFAAREPTPNLGDPTSLHQHV
jgi:hypothetical protein